MTRVALQTHNQREKTHQGYDKNTMHYAGIWPYIPDKNSYRYNQICTFTIGIGVLMIRSHEATAPKILLMFSSIRITSSCGKPALMTILVMTWIQKFGLQASSSHKTKHNM
jgi:hypothetical protein